MGHSEVPRIELNKNGTITLYVDVPNFDEGTPIEISGQATQANGAVATFYSVQIMPRHGTQDKPLAVRSVRAVPPNQFAEGFPITVVARAAEAWITTLEFQAPDPDEGAQPNRGAVWQGNPSKIKAAWKSSSYGYAVQASPSEEASSSAPETESADGSQSGERSSSVQLWHGTWWEGVKEKPLDTVTEGRFTRLFPRLRPARFEWADLQQLAEAMTAPPENEPTRETEDDPEENRGIPAAYTYLGQFIDHDLTFDPTSQLRATLNKKQLQALVDFRTPRFDLDNLYGRGPDEQPYMYKRHGIRMLLGEPMPDHPFDPGAHDLPRGPNRRALIGDPRNDENRIVAQLHAIFLRFHNKVAHHRGGKGASFQDVREQVRWHYQWVLVNDFLRTILEEKTYRSVFPNPYTAEPVIPGLENGIELMPVEFSVAAYRFGHSMIRPQYRLNPAIRRPIFSDRTDDDDLGGFRPIPAGWAIDWQRFIDLEHRAGPPARGKPQLSYKIDTSLVHPLGHLPRRIATDPSSLALRNLERGATFQLPSGQEVAKELGVPPIADDELMIGQATVGSPKTPITKVASGFAGQAPLWTYILAEAQVTSWRHADPGPADDHTPIRLGPVGGRLIAEVFAALLLGDPTSYLRAETAFVPIPEFTHNGAFGLAELINVALGRTP
jgi:hypothetical protein